MKHRTSALMKLLNRKSMVVLALNSGTSADGVDLAAVKIMRTAKGVRTRFLAGSTRPYPARLRSLILNTSDSTHVNLDDLVYLDNGIGEFFGRCAAALASKLEAHSTKIHLIASHGQTVRHCPAKINVAGYKVSGSLQLGSLDRIARRTRLPVVGDFRQAHLALGGEGAPVTGAALKRLLATTEKSRLIVNIGGMANYFYFPGKNSSQEPAAADTGPGNVLCDLLAEKLYGLKFDKDGRKALSGLPSQRLLTLLLADPFFAGERISTGREQFGLNIAKKIMAFGRKHKLSLEDMMATVAEFTCASIAQAVAPLVEKDNSLTKLYLTGGGRKNKFIRSRLASWLPEVEVLAVERLGVDGDYVEAACYAVMAEACLRSEPLICGLAGGRTGSPIMGRIAQPPLVVNQGK